MTRRSLFGVLAAAIAGATLDPERPLWEPGRKLISIPKPAIVTPTFTPDGVYGQGLLNLGDKFTVAGYYAWDPKKRKYLPHLQQFVVTALPPNGGLSGTEFKHWPLV